MTEVFDIQIVQTIAGTRFDHGGTSRSIPDLCDALANHGEHVTLVVGVPADHAIQSNFPGPKVHTVFVPESPRGRHWGIRGRFRFGLEQAFRDARRLTIVHDHGLWLGSNHAVASYCRRKSLPRIVSPRGMLSPWAMRTGGWKKRIAWQLFQKRDLETATAFHATSEMEAKEIRELGFKQPIVIAGNGIRFPDVMPIRESSRRTRTVLFLSRIHPKKGLIPLVHAWADAAVASDWRLKIVGPDENDHRAEVEAVARARGVAQAIEFCGTVDDTQKWSLYSQAELFILPSFSENFGIVIAKALAAGLPVITTTGTPWKRLQELDLGWWIEPNAGAIAVAVRQATNLSLERLEQMSQRAAAWAKSEFGWAPVANTLADFYRSIVGNTVLE